MDEARGIMRTVRHDRFDGEDSFELIQSASLASSIEEVTGSLRIAGFGIGLITLLGASIGLMNIMLVSVTERTREIGVRKAMGATKVVIRNQFLIESVVICVLGGLLGILFGIIIGNLISFALDTGFFVPWFWICTGAVICVIVGLVSGYLPARRAAELDPIESLRFE
jgi:putative ABC transport system permease protein